MRFGYVVPFADAADIGDLAAVAEQHGWDGLFVWESIYGVDAWVALAVAACRTSSLTLGTMLTPLPRRLPWELASQAATVDRLSGGRLVLGVGLGAPAAGWESFGIDTDRRRRAERLDEGLAVLRGLWRGQPFTHDGRHYRLTPTDFPTIGHTTRPTGVPVWCVAALGRPRSMQRALACDGLIPQVIIDGAAAQAAPADLVAIGHDRPTDRPFDIVVEGATDGHSPTTWEAAGATWYLVSQWEAVGAPDAVERARTRLAAGPLGQG